MVFGMRIKNEKHLGIFKSICYNTLNLKRDKKSSTLDPIGFTRT
jgi:hypothetical protein